MLRIHWVGPHVAPFWWNILKVAVKCALMVDDRKKSFLRNALKDPLYGVMVRDNIQPVGGRLAPEQREEVQHLIRPGWQKLGPSECPRARILLKSDDGWPAPQVAEAWTWPFQARCTGSSSVLPRRGWICPGGPGAGPSVPEAGRPGRGPPGGAGLQPSAGRA